MPKPSFSTHSTARNATTGKAPQAHKAPRHLEGAGFRIIGQPLTADHGFCFDNETPAHQVWGPAFEIARTLVSNQDWCDFIADGGYQRYQLWTAAGWDLAQSERWNAPLYWRQQDGSWEVFTLHGWTALNPHEPVCHVSWFEAEAFAAWAGGRLPLENEWEHTVLTRDSGRTPTASGNYHPQTGVEVPGQYLQQAFASVWQWTRSPYEPYPHFKPAAGAVGEYNGKFMCGQYVLKGSSCLTPENHSRASYRNFFAPQHRWQMTGVRLAFDCSPEPESNP